MARRGASCKAARRVRADTRVMNPRCAHQPRRASGPSASTSTLDVARRTSRRCPRPAATHGRPGCPDRFLPAARCELSTQKPGGHRRGLRQLAPGARGAPAGWGRLGKVGSRLVSTRVHAHCWKRVRLRGDRDDRSTARRASGVLVRVCADGAGAAAASTTVIRAGGWCRSASRARNRARGHGHGVGVGGVRE